MSGLISSLGALLSPDAVQDLWRQHLTRWRDRKEVLWSLLMFQAWWEAWNDDRGQAEAALSPAVSRISS